MSKIATFFNKLKNMWSTPPKGKYLNIKEIVTFGSYTLGNSFLSTGVGYVVTIVYIPYFYGINQIHAYIIMGLGALINLVLQPLLGSLMERTNTKFGRYKPYILFSLPLFSLFAILATWLPQFEIEASRVIYAYLCCIPVIVLQTFSNNMYSTMPSIITPIAQERADIMTPIGLIQGFAPSILQIFVGFIRGYFLNKGMEFMGLRLIGLFATVIGSLMVLSIIKVKERVHVMKDKSSQEEKIGFLNAVRMLLKNKALIVLFLALAFGSLREFIKMFIVIIIQVRFHENPGTALMLSGFILSIVGFGATVSMFLLPFLTRKFSRHTLIIMFTAIGAISYTVLGLIGYQNIPVGGVSVGVITTLFFLSSINATYLLVPIMLGEICDHQQAISGKRLEGYIQALLFSVPVLLSFVFMIGSLFLQNEVGFELKNYKDKTILTELERIIAGKWFNVASIISGISGLITITILFFYPLNKAKYAGTLKVLDEKSEIKIQ